MSIFWRPRGCVLWFDFAELSGNTVYDLSRNNNNGTIYGASWRRSHLIGALSFDGVDDWVEAPPMVVGRNWTYELWVKTLAYATTDRATIIFHKGPVESVVIRIRTTGELHIVTIDSDKVRIDLSTPILPLDKFSHIILRRSDEENVLQAWINGELVDSSVDTRTGTWDTTSVLRFCRPYYAPFEYFNCIIGNVRIYNRALTEREIKAHYYYLTSLVRQVI